MTVMVLGVGSGFVRRQRLDAEGVNLAAHGFTERIIDETVALQKALAGEGRRHNGDIEMPAAAQCTGVPGMMVEIACL